MNRRRIVLSLAIFSGLTLSAMAFAQVRPDLVVTDLRVDPDQTGRLMGKVIVTVANVCRTSESGQSFVIVTFKESERPGAKAIYFVGSRLRILRGGESQTVQFDPASSAKEVAISSHVVAEVDPYKKVSEASEENNWRTLNPAAGGTPVERSQCK